MNPPEVTDIILAIVAFYAIMAFAIVIMVGLYGR